MHNFPSPPSDKLDTAASRWLAKRDRGLTPAEQDAYLEWLQKSPDHGREIVRLERVWGLLNQLEQWRPAHSAFPNPDLLAPHRKRKALIGFGALLAVAAAWILLALPAGVDPLASPREAIIHPGPEKLTLADGSLVELNQGARVEEAFTANERRVRLVSGEAFFVVARDPIRPFVVEAGDVTVAALGTAFDVLLAAHEVAVLVTEGRVQVDRPGTSTAEALPSVVLNPRQRAVVPLHAGPITSPVVHEVTPAEVDRALSWKGLRLEFVDMTLEEVVKTFNRYNRRKLVVNDPETAAILVAGNFRADNVDGFVRLLDAGFGVTAIPNGDELILRRSR